MTLFSGTQEIDPSYEPVFWKGSLKSIHSEYESLKPAEDTEQGHMEQVADDGPLVTVVVSSEITENSVAVPPTSTKPKAVNSAGYIPDFTQIDSSHVLKNQVDATKEQEQAMLANDTQTNAISSPYLDEQSLLANQENNDIHALSTQKNNDQVSNDSTSGEFHNASSLPTVVASFSPDTAEQQSSTSTPPGYIKLDYDPQALNYQTQITWEPQSVHFDQEVEDECHFQNMLAYGITDSIVDQSVAGQIDPHDTPGMHATTYETQTV